MLLSIECKDATGTLERIKSAASQSCLGEAAWDGVDLVIADEKGPLRFTMRLEISVPPAGFVRFESFTPVGMPHREAMLARKRTLAETLRRLIDGLMIDEGLGGTYEISIAELYPPPRELSA